MLSKISQFSLEKYMCWSFFLRKLKALGPANLLNRDFNTGIFLWNWQDFQSLSFTEHFQWLVLKISNSNILFKDFSGIPLRHSKSLITYNSHNDQLNLRMYSLTKNFSVTDVEQTRRDLINNFNNFAVLFHFRITLVEIHFSLLISHFFK